MQRQGGGEPANAAAGNDHPIVRHAGSDPQPIEFNYPSAAGQSKRLVLLRCIQDRGFGAYRNAKSSQLDPIAMPAPGLTSK